AHCSSAEVRLFADKAKDKKIPVINTTVPNDGGTNNNPYFVVLNPTLRTQCQGVYKFVQNNYPTRKIVVFRKKGTLEDAVKSYFEESVKSVEGTALKIKYVDLVDSFSVADLRKQLDTVSQTVCLAGSFDVAFGDRLIKQLAGLNLKKYRSVVIGMPTWETLKGLSKPEYKGMEIIYSTPFHNAKNDATSKRIIHYFDKKLYQRATDISFRGFEVTYKFAKLLLQHGKDFSSNLGSHQYTLFTEYDLQPVLSRDMTLNYFENKQLYFLKWLDGVMRVVE
ncbi:MAG: ABC transporter substrate-binding protein, partial [Pedobacter sp.]